MFNFPQNTCHRPNIQLIFLGLDIPFPCLDDTSIVLRRSVFSLLFFWMIQQKRINGISDLIRGYVLLVPGGVED